MNYNILKYIVKEFFWADYNINEEIIEKKLKENDLRFKSFLISKILYSNFSYIILKKLFTIEELKNLLPEDSTDRYLSKKIKILRTILFNEEHKDLRKWR